VASIACLLVLKHHDHGHVQPGWRASVGHMLAEYGCMHLGSTLERVPLC
jgi:hypothetical protein